MITRSFNVKSHCTPLMLKSKLIKLIFLKKERGKASLYLCDWFLVTHLPYYLCTGTMSTMPTMPMGGYKSA